jgi:nucleoside-diphosphate kinase
MKTLQRTLAIIKPDAVRKNVQGEIITMILKEGFRIIGIKMLHITDVQAEGFYAVHAGKPFFASLTKFMSSGPIVVMALEKEETAIADWRKLMGATNPANAEPGTIRKKFAANIEQNAVHGSDAEDTARFELGYFFAGYELAG